MSNKPSCCHPHEEPVKPVKSSCCHTPDEPDKPAEHQHAGCCPTDHAHAQRIDWLFWGSLLLVAGLYTQTVFFPQLSASIAWLETMGHAVHSTVNAMWWGVLVGALFVGVMSKIPREFVMSILGKGGTVSGLLRATGAGVLLDLCSHGILLVAAKLYERGASAGQVIAFLLASPWNSFSLTLILVGLIGFYWTAVFIVLSMLIAWVTGWVFDALVKRNVLPANPYQLELPENFKFWPEVKTRLQETVWTPSLLKDIMVSGIRDSKMTLRWLLLGIVLSAGLKVVLDPDQFQSFFGPTALGLLVTLFVATVLEVCSEGATPIAADILTRAHAPGNAFAFLMAGVATDYTEMMVLKETTKSWKLALCLPLITVPQVLLVAWLINMNS
jgi:uncharacterized membrane protein YraQ (UPF0718 family)